MQLSDTNRSRAWTTKWFKDDVKTSLSLVYFLFGFQWTFLMFIDLGSQIICFGRDKWRAKVSGTETLQIIFHGMSRRNYLPAPLAQLVEQLTLNQWVPGSNPWRCTKFRWSETLIVGIFYGEGPPVPIPNTEVKLTCAEDTRMEASRENRSMPTQAGNRGIQSNMK